MCTRPTQAMSNYTQEQGSKLTHQYRKTRWMRRLIFDGRFVCLYHPLLAALATIHLFAGALSISVVFHTSLRAPSRPCIHFLCSCPCSGSLITFGQWSDQCPLTGLPVPVFLFLKAFPATILIFETMALVTLLPCTNTSDGSPLPIEDKIGGFSPPTFPSPPPLQSHWAACLMPSSSVFSEVSVSSSVKWV